MHARGVLRVCALFVERDHCLEDQHMPNPEPQGCLAVILGFFGIRLGAKSKLPYRQRDDFLSKAEMLFYRVLVSVVDRTYTICMKVRLADIVFVSVKEGWQSHQNRIDRKHIDFLLCDKDSMTPVLGIELDDKSHSRQDRQDRDEFVNEVFEAAGLPILRVPAAARYVPADLFERIEAALKQTVRKPLSSRQPLLNLVRMAFQPAPNARSPWFCAPRRKAIDMGRVSGVA